jgi:hypothetical protein
MQLLIAGQKMSGAIRWAHFANATRQRKLIQYPPPFAFPRRDSTNPIKMIIFLAKIKWKIPRLLPASVQVLPPPRNFGLMA